MAQTINTNVISLNAQRNLNTSSASLATTIQRLSSGLRINSAKDDAAGLAISQRFTTQINGLTVASRNANDGISLAQTAEGALSTIGDNLQRIRELAVQAANATNSSTDRDALQAEVTQLASEIDRVAKQSDFNGTKLLDGSFASQLFQVGANAGQAISIDATLNAKVDALGAAKFASGVSVAASGVTSGAVGVSGLTINGTTIDAISGTATSTSTDNANALVAAINAKIGETGVYAAISGGNLTLTSIKANQDLAVSGTVTNSGLTAATNAYSGQTDVHLKDVSISSVSGASQALEIVDKALTAVSSARADLGAIQNRFTSVISNLGTSSENMSASRSRIVDADYATETANLTKAQILQQAGTAMLAQANAVPQTVLSLLK